MATIANQIARIQAARDLLRDKGVKLGLYVPAGSYWDDATDTNVSTTAAELLNSADQIDKIAAAFNSIGIYHDQVIKVPMTIKRDGTTVVGESTSLATGFYSGGIITPYITVEDSEDLVINVQTITDRELTAQTGIIVPADGFNYIDSLSYKVKDGAISATPTGYDNSGVTVKVETSGWLDSGDTKKVTVDTSTMSKKVGTGTATTVASGAEIVPNATADTVVTITKGIYGSDRTLTVKSVASQTAGTATAEDILDGKTAWAGGQQITGTMPNYGGTDSEEKITAMESISNNGGYLAIQPQLGYYNDYSTITTGIVYDPTRVFNTTNNSASVTETMTSQTYYETIPAGYYSEAILRKITVRSAVGNVSVDYTNHKAKFNLTQTGWISQGAEVAISAGPAVYAQTQADLESTTHGFVITPAKDIDGTTTSYLTQVTVDNTLIFDLLAAI